MRACNIKGPQQPGTDPSVASELSSYLTRLKMNALTLFIFITVFSSFESSPGAAFSPQDLIAHHIAKRQTITDSDVECASIVSDYICGTSGYGQQIVDIALGCKYDFYARSIATQCAKNERGEICATATLKIFDGRDMNANSCLGAVTSGSCPSTCHSFLKSASSDLGCCIGTYINLTASPESMTPELLDYACGACAMFHYQLQPVKVHYPSILQKM